MKPEEAFVLHMGDLWNDCVNNHNMLLELVAERMPAVTDYVHGDIKAFLLRQVEILNTKKARAMRDIIEFAGGEAKYRALRHEDFHADCIPAAKGWRKEANDKTA